MNTDVAIVEIALVSHTNAGKTTLARTLLGRDIGEVRDAPHVTEIAEVHTLLQTDAGDALRLWDTPGFGDSARLVQRLRLADNPIGWLLREVWDRYRDRPFWCNQQAVRAARDNSDVVLYLVNAAENPRDAGYIAFEAQVLRWIGKPVVVLLNQVGPPRPPEDERAEAQRWGAHLESLGIAAEVLELDAFARCWVQERVLLDAVGRQLSPDKRAGYDRLVATWISRNVARFDAAMELLAQHLQNAARDFEAVAAVEASTAQRLMHSVGIKRDAIDLARDRAMQALAARLDAGIRDVTNRLIELHGLEGHAADAVLERMRTHFAVEERVDETRAALWGSVITGALAGLKADVVAGGLTLGAGMLVGGVIGGLTGAGVARGMNRLARSDQPQVRWSSEFLNGLVRSSLLRYLAVSHFGRGRGKYVEGESPAFWRAEVEQQISERTVALRTIWDAEVDPARSDQSVHELRSVLTAATIGVLDKLYPATVPAELRDRTQSRGAA